MITMEKDLPAVGDVILLDIPSDTNGSGTVQYVSGAGTVVLEGRVTQSNVWVTMALTPMAGGAAVLLLTVVGGWTFEVKGLDQIRVRKTVGVASCVIALGFGFSR